MVEGIGGTAWDSNLASLRVFMATLRKKLENDSNAYIQTHVGIGYRMLKADTKEN
nr:helix-turn-helix domain-containing protein [Lachnospiraceae bacterium C1.1]